MITLLDDKSLRVFIFNQLEKESMSIRYRSPLQSTCLRSQRTNGVLEPGEWEAGTVARPAIRNEMGNFLHYRICKSVFLKLSHTHWRNCCKEQDFNLLIHVWIRFLIYVGVWQCVCEVKSSPFLLEKLQVMLLKLQKHMLKMSRDRMKRLVYDCCERLVISLDSSLLTIDGTFCMEMWQ